MGRSGRGETVRVLCVAPSFYPARIYGGPIESVCHLCRGLSRNGNEVRVLTTDANGPRSVLDVRTDCEVPLAEGVRVRYCHRQMSDSVSLTLLRLLPSYIHWADVVHLTAAYSFPSIPTLLACKAMGKPVVWAPHGGFQRWEGSTRVRAKAVWEWICRIGAPKKLILHVTSQEEATASRKRFPGVKAVVIPNGIEIPEKVAHKYGDGMLRLLYLGRLHPIKGIENLLAACKILNDRSDLAWSLTIAGTGDPNYVESLRARVDTLKLVQCVQMIGAVEGAIKESLFEEFP